MKALELSAKMRAQFTADGAFAGVKMLDDVSSETIALPNLIFAMDAKAMNDAGTALAWTLTIWVESRAEKRAAADPDPVTAHKTLTEAVRTKLLTTGKAALRAALNAAGGFSWRGWSAVESDPGTEAHHFRTPIMASGTALVL